MKKPQNATDKLDLVAATSGREAAAGTGFSAARLGAGLEAVIGKCRVEMHDIAEGGTPHPSILFVCQDAAAKPGALIFFPAMLLERLFVQAYGGDRAESAAATPSAAQLRHARRLGKRLAAWIITGWPDDARPTLNAAETLFDRKEHPQTINAFDTGKSIGFQVGIDSVSYEVQVAIATGLLAAAPRQQAAPGASPNAALLRQQMIARTGQVRLSVRSEIEVSAMPASRLVALRPGDVLPLAMPRSVAVLVGERRFASASVGEWQGSAALRIESLYESYIA